MPTKMSDKKLAIGIVLIGLGLMAFLKSTVIVTPIRISEINILWSLFSLVLIFLGIRLLKSSIMRMN